MNDKLDDDFNNNLNGNADDDNKVYGVGITNKRLVKDRVYDLEEFNRGEDESESAE